MIELGKKEQCFGIDLLQGLTNIHSRPNTFPRVPAGHAVICGYDQGLGERLFVCQSLEDMQYLYDGYSSGGALRINWYSGPEPGMMLIIRT